MKPGNAFFLSLALLFHGSLQAHAGALTVTVNNIAEAGEIHLAIYDDADAFESDEGETGDSGAVAGAIEKVDPGSATYMFDLPDGVYSIGVYVDANYNGELDKMIFGIPTEQYGFSNNARANFAPPSFEDAAFEVTGRVFQSIDLQSSNWR